MKGCGKTAGGKCAERAVEAGARNVRPLFPASMYDELCILHHVYRIRMHSDLSFSYFIHEMTLKGLRPEIPEIDELVSAVRSG